jgi:tetratricopeptide (TPR) repeat protein/transposase-like protein
MGDVEQARILEALRETRGNISRAADRLGVTRNILRYRLKKYGLDVSFGTTEPLAPAQPVSPMAEPARAPRTAHVQWERRHVALLWVDLVAPAAEETVPYVGPALDTVLQKIGSFGGQVEEVSPSDLVAVFGLDPVEDAPRRAAHAALAIQRAARAPGHPAESPRVRIALHVGEVLVAWVGSAARVDHAAKREALRQLAAFMADAEAGVLVSETTRPFLERRFVLSPSVSANGTAGTAYRLVGLHQTGLGLGDRLTPFVGRDRELEQLADALEQAKRRHGQVVALVGEAGVGKSRLFWEFIESPRTRDSLIVVGSAASYGKSMPYLPVIDLLRKYFKIDPRDNSKTIKDRITEKMLSLEQGLAPAVSAVLALLDLPIDDAQWQPLDPQQKRQRTLEAVKLLLLEESRRGPVVLVFEDLHWIDSETQAVLDTLVDSLPSQRVLLLVSYRPEYQHTWNRKTYYAQLRLDALSREDSQVLLDSLLGTEKAMAALKATLVERTGGNPFFLEESVRTLVETDVLTGDRGAYGLSRPVGDIRVPATVEAVLAARIERLPPEDKSLLQTAAVIGEDVPFSLLQAIAERSDDALRRSLSNLQAAEFLYEARLLPDLEYTFKHALTQQVAYRSVLQQRRRALHVRIGDAIEAAFFDRLTEHVERLAHHARRGELWDKALRYMRQAGQRAALRSAHREAVPCFDEALVALSHLPDSQQALELGIDLRLELRNSLMALGDIERESVLISEARDRAEAIGDRRRLSQSLIFESNHFVLSGAPRRAVESAGRALSMSEGLGDVWLELQARYELAKAWNALGDYRRAAQGFAAVVEAIEGQGVRRGGPGIGAVHSRTLLATNLSGLGEFAWALVRAEEAVRIAEAAAYDFSVIHGHCVVGLVHARQGNVEMAIGPLERSRRISEARDIKIFFRTIASALGSAYSLSGRSREAVTLLEEAREWTAGQPLSGGALLTSELGMAYLRLGRLADARNAAGEALEIARRRSERGVEAWVLRLWGEIYASQEPPDIEHAEAPYAAAMERANELGMRPLLAHCHLGLGKLYRRTGKREQALKHLTTAATMYREMEMTYWLEQTQTEMRTLA